MLNCVVKGTPAFRSMATTFNGLFFFAAKGKGFNGFKGIREEGQSHLRRNNHLRRQGPRRTEGFGPKSRQNGRKGIRSFNAYSTLCTETLAGSL